MHHKFEIMQEMLVYKRYIAAIVVFSLVPLLVIAFLNYIFLFEKSLLPEQSLYRHRLEKLDSDYEIILVGDSSLGNSIDEAMFTKLAGKKTVNLALTGLYGYAGTYNIIRRAISINPHISYVIVVQTTDMMERKVSYNGYLYSFYNIRNLKELSFSVNVRLLKEAINILASSNNLKVGMDAYFVPKEYLVENDYIGQGPRMNTSIDPKPLDPININEDKSYFINKIVEYCNSKGVKLIYFHGPLWEEVANISTPYFNNLNRTILNTGINLIPEVIRIGSTDIGDEYDHVSPIHKQKYTKQFFKLLESHIQN